MEQEPLSRHRAYISDYAARLATHPIALVDLLSLDVGTAEHYLDWSGFGHARGGFVLPVVPQRERREQASELARIPPTEHQVRPLTRTKGRPPNFLPFASLEL